MKILVSLLSENGLSVHKGASFFAPEKHIILCHESASKYLKRFNNSVIVEKITDETQTLLGKCQSIIESHPNDEIHFHLTGGTEVMRLTCLSFACQKKLPAHFIHQNTLFTISSDGVSQSDFKDTLTVDEYLSLHGFRIIKNSDELASAQRLLTALSNYLTSSHIQRLTSAEDGEFLIRMPGRLEVQVDQPKGESQKVIIKTSGFQKLIDAESLIELYAVQQLTPKYKSTIHLAFRIVREGGNPRDVDISFMKDGLLHILVTRNNPNIRGGIFEQLFAIHQRFDGLTAKIYFLMKESSATNPNNLKRANLFGIELISVEQLSSL